MSSAVYPSITPWALREEGGVINNLTASRIITESSPWSVFFLNFFSHHELYSLTSCQKCFHILREAAEEFVLLQEES